MRRGSRRLARPIRLTRVGRVVYEMVMNPQFPLVVVMRSLAETLALGRRIGRAARPGDVVALIGELGAGKTALTKGVLAGLGGNPDDVTSPTFVLMLRHDGGRLPLFHFDAYRLAGGAELVEIGAEEGFYGKGLSVIEWADRVAGVLPENRLEMRLRVTGRTEREIALTPLGDRARALAEVLIEDS